MRTAPFLVLLAASAAAAEPPTQLLGRITDAKTHAAIDGVTVIVSTPSGERRELETDENGLYRVVLPAAGEYDVSFAYGDAHVTRHITAAAQKVTQLDDVVTAPGETIIVHDQPVAPKVAPKPKQSRWKTPPYSDYAMEHDTWTRAWLLLDVDPTGKVSRAKYLHRPGAELDEIGLRYALGLTFEPARDAQGQAVRTLMVWPLEWASYGWLLERTGVTTAIPNHSLPSHLGRPDILGSRSGMVTGSDILERVPCKGTAGLVIDSIHPALRDCTPPPPSSAGEREPWVDRATLDKH